MRQLVHRRREELPGRVARALSVLPPPRSREDPAPVEWRHQACSARRGVHRSTGQPRKRRRQPHSCAPNASNTLVMTEELAS